jgi:hypothetical protein
VTDWGFVDVTGMPNESDVITADGARRRGMELLDAAARCLRGVAPDTELAAAYTCIADSWLGLAWAMESGKDCG